MKTAKITIKDWPKWLRILFTISGFLFILLFIILARQITFHYFNMSVNSMERWNNFKQSSDLIALLADILVTILTLQAISLTLKQGNNFKNIAIAVFSCLAGIFLLFTIESYNTITDPFIPVTGGAEEQSAVPMLATISGLLTAITGLYGQITSSRKTKVELELAKQQLALEQRKIELEASKQNKER